MLQIQKTTPIINNTMPYVAIDKNNSQINPFKVQIEQAYRVSLLDNNQFKLEALIVDGLKIATNPDKIFNDLLSPPLDKYGSSIITSKSIANFKASRRRRVACSLLKPTTPITKVTVMFDNNFKVNAASYIEMPNVVDPIEQIIISHKTLVQFKDDLQAKEIIESTQSIMAKLGYKNLDSVPANLNNFHNLCEFMVAAGCGKILDSKTQAASAAYSHPLNSGCIPSPFKGISVFPLNKSEPYQHPLTETPLVFATSASSVSALLNWQCLKGCPENDQNKQDRLAYMAYCAGQSLRSIKANGLYNKRWQSKIIKTPQDIWQENALKILNYSQQHIALSPALPITTKAPHEKVIEKMGWFNKPAQWVEFLKHAGNLAKQQPAEKTPDMFQQAIHGLGDAYNTQGGKKNLAGVFNYWLENYAPIIVASTKRPKLLL